MKLDEHHAPKAAAVHRMADELGFALVGIASAQPTEHREFIKKWIADGHHGQMDYLAKNLSTRLDPRVLLPGAQSVICVADYYGQAFESKTDEQSAGHAASKPAPLGRIARYAWGDDYHKIIKKRLFDLADALQTSYPDHEYRCAVDTAPLLEREHARRAGLGWVGKHTLLIHRQLGSWLLLGQIVTTLDIATSAETDYPYPTDAPTDHCGTCTRCIDACPTDCITPYQLDARRCISYLTIEHRGLIDPQLHSAMGDWLAGCDVCQEVCPFNGGQVEMQTDAETDSDDEELTARRRIHPRYQTRFPAPAISLLDVLNWDAESRQQAFVGSALKRIKLDMLKRNALIAAGNVLQQESHPALRTRIAELADDPNQPDMVRQTARLVISGLSAAEDTASDLDVV